MCVVVFYHNLFSGFRWKYKGSNIRSVVQFRHWLYVRPPFHSKTKCALLLSWSPIFRGQNLLRDSRSFSTSSHLPFHVLFLPSRSSIIPNIYLPLSLLNIFCNSPNFHISCLTPHDQKIVFFYLVVVVLVIFMNNVYGIVLLSLTFPFFFQFLSILTDKNLLD